jgi:hypothetical protein
MRLTDNFEYFVNMKRKKEENAQVLIAYHWRKKSHRINEIKKSSLTKPTDKKIV